MNPSRNDITGDFILSNPSSNAYRDGWERIFGSKKKEEQLKVEAVVESLSTTVNEITLPSVAFFLQMIEYERGRGSKPDGYLAFATQEAAEKYSKERHANRSADVPDYYVNYNNVGWLPINSEVATKLINSEHGFIFVDDPYTK